MTTKLQILLEMKKLIDKKIAIESRRSKKPSITKFNEELAKKDYNFGIIMTINKFMEVESIDDIHDLADYDGYDMLVDIESINPDEDYIIINVSTKGYNLGDAIDNLRLIDIDDDFNYNLAMIDYEDMTDNDASLFMNNLVDIEEYNPEITIAYIYQGNNQLAGSKNLSDIEDFNIVIKDKNIVESIKNKDISNKISESGSKMNYEVLVDESDRLDSKISKHKFKSENDTEALLKVICDDFFGIEDDPKAAFFEEENITTTPEFNYLADYIHTHNGDGGDYIISITNLTTGKVIFDSGYFDEYSEDDDEDDNY